MTNEESKQRFYEQAATLFVVIDSMIRARSLLQRSVQGQTITKTPADERTTRILARDYLINNLAAIFDEIGGRISFLNIEKKYRRQFPASVFSEYSRQLKIFLDSHKDDIERIRKNRNLMTAHLGSGDNGRLGFEAHVAKNRDELIGGKSPVAEKASLRFITAYNILEIPVVQKLQELKKMLQCFHREVMSL